MSIVARADDQVDSSIQMLVTSYRLPGWLIRPLSYIVNWVAKVRYIQYTFLYCLRGNYNDIDFFFLYTVKITANVCTLSLAQLKFVF